MINTTNTSNRTTSYFYNDFGEVVKVHSPVTGVTTYQYNASGLIIGQQRQDGSRSLYTRDAAQRVEPYRVCRRVNILRDYSDEKTKLYPRN